ncbi:MAG: hypothetical protein ACE5IR_15010 [bacterium]
MDHPKHVAAGMGHERIQTRQYPGYISVSIQFRSDIGVAPFRWLGRRNSVSVKIDQRVLAGVVSWQSCRVARRVLRGLRKAEV